MEVTDTGFRKCYVNQLQILKCFDGLSLICCHEDCGSCQNNGGGQTNMVGPAPVIHTLTNPAFRFTTNLLSTALLTRLLF